MSRGAFDSNIILAEKFLDHDGDENFATWTTADHNAAMKQGWYLDHEDGAIQADPDGERFADAEEAINHVRALANDGDVRCILAMIFDTSATLKAWTDRLQETAE